MAEAVTEAVVTEEVVTEEVTEAVVTEAVVTAVGKAVARHLECCNSLQSCHSNSPGAHYPDRILHSKCNCHLRSARVLVCPHCNRRSYDWLDGQLRTPSLHSRPQ